MADRGNSIHSTFRAAKRTNDSTIDEVNGKEAHFETTTPVRRGCGVLDTFAERRSRNEAKILLGNPMRLALLAIVICTALARSQGVSEDQASSDLVRRFAKLDFDGYRLDSEGHKTIWDLTIDDGAPPESPLYVVRKYTTGPARKLPDGSIRVPIDYELIGVIQDGPKVFSFMPKPTISKEIFPVKCTGIVCKIDLDRAVFRVSPHVGKEAVLAWIKGLLRTRETEREKQADRRLYEQVSAAK